MNPNSSKTIPITSNPVADGGGSWSQRNTGFASVAGFHITHLVGAVFPAFAGLMFFGWRAALMLIVILLAALLGLGCWMRIGARGRQLHVSQAIWPAVLLWLMLPAHLMQWADGLWMIPVAAGILLAIIMWLIAGGAWSRLPAALPTYLVLAWTFGPVITQPQGILQRHRILTGDILSATEPAYNAYMKDGYLQLEALPHVDALRIDPPARKLNAFTSGRERTGRSRLSLDSLLRDQMPPLEDLIVGGYPGPVGATCAVAVIIGGLLLLTRGVIDYRVPLTVCVGAYLALLMLPIPVIIRETNEPLPVTRPSKPPAYAPPPAPASPGWVGGAQWRWLAFRDSVEVGWAKAITFANYEVMAGPMLFMTFFLATWPGLRPLSRRGRVLYGLLTGVIAAGLQIYVSIAWGAYLALLIASLFSPVMDRLFRQRPLV